MNDRITRLMRGVDIARTERYPLSVTKALNITESFKATEGEPHILRIAKAFAHVIENATLFIEDDQLIVGNPASRPWGVELTALWGTWPDDEIDSLEEAGYILDDNVREHIPAINEYWSGRSLTSLMAKTYDEDRLWPYAQMGVVLPAFRSKEEGWGAGGLLGGGYGIQHEISQMIGTPDFGMVLTRGLNAIIADVEERERNNHLTSPEAFERREFYRAALIELRAVQHFISRFEKIARADAETASEKRRTELLAIADICSQVSTGPARNLREAIQLFWFLYVCMLPSGTLGMGRLDQLFNPWYSADVERGDLSYDDAVELIACLRLRSTEVTIQGGKAHRNKWAGGSKWHNCIIGGQSSDGADATNDLSFAFIEAAKVCPTPHFTLTMRVHKDTPSALIQAGIDLARTGIGMPAFVGDEAIVAFLEAEGVPTETALNYNMAGSNSVTLMAESRMVASPMFVTPRVLMITLAGGVDPRTGFSMGGTNLSLAEMSSFDELKSALQKQLHHYLGLQAEFNNVTVRSIGNRFPRPLDSVLMKDGIELGKDLYTRVFDYDNSNLVNPIGIINTADSLAAIKKLVFDDKTVSAERLVDAMARDWSGEGDEEIRALCEAAPKYGNDDDYVDEIAVWVHRVCAESIVTFGTATGGFCKPSALTIGTSPWPGGVSAGPTPDGRFAADPLAEESMTPMRGREKGTVWDVIASAAKIDQSPYQATELDLRFTKDAVSSPEAEVRLEQLIRTYFADGGKHVQFNISDLDELHEAMLNPGGHPDAKVRLGGTTAFFMQLSRTLQEEMLKRNYFTEIPER